MDNVNQTIASQYGNGPTINQLIENMNGYLDPSADWDAFYNFVWNVDTAQGFGLDFWGKVVNVSRQIKLTDPVQNFGFNEAPGYYPFGQAPLYNGPPASNVYNLSDDAYRTLIKIKALANISDNTAPSLNQLLQTMFKGRGRCYVVNDGNMRMRLVFEFALLPYEIAILTQSGAIPRPGGVSAMVLEVDVPTTFGFKESILAQPFGQGVLFNPSVGLINAS